MERLYYPPPLRLFSLDLYYVKMLFIRQGQTLRTRPDICRPSERSMKRENAFDQFFYDEMKKRIVWMMEDNCNK